MSGSAWSNQVQNQVIIAGTSGQLLVYSGTPAAGNLIGSISAVNGTDLFGNAYLAGITNYLTTAGNARTAVQVFAGTVAWYHAPSAAGPYTEISLIVQNAAGTLLSLAAPSIASDVAGDGNTYNISSATFPATAVPQTINQTGATTITGCSAGLAAVPYRVRGVVQFTANAAAGNPSLQIGVSATTNSLWGNAIIWQTTGTGAGANRFVANTSGTVFQGPGMVSGAVYFAQIDAFMSCTSTGTVSLQAFTSIAADTFTVNNAFLYLQPLA